MEEKIDVLLSEFAIWQYSWSGNEIELTVDYVYGENHYLFQYSGKNAFDQFESELRYIVRIHDRGIGSKEYYLHTMRLK